jgi:hypothetical protein
MANSTQLDILLTIRDIANGCMTTQRLAERRGVSERTIKNYIAQARHLGADIKSFRVDGVYYWNLPSYSDIEQRVEAWIDLELNKLKSVKPKDDEFNFSESYPNIDEYLKSKDTEITDFHKDYIHNTVAPGEEFYIPKCYILAAQGIDGRWRVEVEGAAGIWWAVPASEHAPFGQFATWQTLEALQAAWRPVLGYDVTTEE